MQVKSTFKINWDAIGIGASLACAVHCVLLPVLFTTLTFFDIELLENIYMEIGTILISMLAGGWALLHGYRHHHQRISLVIMFIVGLALMIGGNFFHHGAHEWLEMVAKLSGAILIISAHIMNYKACKTQHPRETTANA
ncbi:MerC mercury resistance protein [Chitinophaga skermanii]|uniref:MerC mercury resistance protein n=1 Tax=Chitinophaga skermanii TaxID=331697 RepID=A0A327QKZ3_9BACT|nr:MerC domain-containing protein [Chitinophaga skermanii]RAJ02417.1 MerC mercury resistance protein [Chitinophaga skermanii]